MNGGRVISKNEEEPPLLFKFNYQISVLDINEQ